MSDLTPILIEDSRRTPELERTRSGSTMIFTEPFKGPIGPTGFKIEAPAPELVAQLRDGQWFWINDCPECNGKPARWAYSKCEEHNVCCDCKTPRAQITETCWGTTEGFRCQTCQDILKEKTRREAFEELDKNEYDEFDYHDTDQPACPHCGSSYNADTEKESGKEKCEVCGGEYLLEINYSVSYTTTVIGERITA